jgi:phage-related protein
VAGKATLVIDITADTAGAIGGIDKTTGAVKSYGDAASTAAKQSRDISGGIESTGDTAAMATTGLRDLGGAMETMGGTVGKMGTAMVTASTAFEAMDGAATLYKSAQTAATAAAGGFSKAMQFMKLTILTNPIFIIAAIIIGIAVALVIAYQRSETFRRIVDGAFKAVLGAIKAVWNWVRSNWPLLLAILGGPIGLAVALIIKHWDKIKGGAQTALDTIKRVWGNVQHLLTAPFTAAWDVISGVFDKIVGAVRNALDWIGRLKFPSPPSWLSAVIPGSFAAAPVAGVGRGAAAAPRAAGGGPTIVVNGALDPEAVARQVRRLLASSDRRGGRTGVLHPIGTV